MATQNLIQIKRSETTAEPGSLANGELAWSGNGDVLFIGNFGSVTAIASATSGNIIDDDTFATASNTSLATSESIKAYVDTEIANVVAGAATNLNDLSDVNTSGVAQGDLLGYNGSSWVDYDINGTSSVITVSKDATSITIDIADTAVSPGSYGDANSVATFTVDQQGRLTAAGTSDINHDTLLNFVSNEHIDHSSVSVTAGDGLTGGGTIAATRTIDVGEGYGIAVSENAVAVDNTEIRALFSAAGDLSYNSTTGEFSFTNDAGDIESVTAGDGLTGGGANGDVTINVGAGNGITVAADTVSVDGANGISVTADGVNVLANNGISVTSDGVLVDGANGISVTTAGVNVLAGNNQIVSNTTGIWISSVTAAQISDDIALGTDTSGNYVATITAGNGIASLTGTGEGSAPTITVDGANGISVTAAGVNVLANNGIIANTTGVFVDGANGISVTTAGVNVLAGNNQIVSNTTGIWISSITAAQISDDITLGTDTTGNYVATIAGTTNEIEVTGSGSEDAAVTIGLPNDVTITNDLSVGNDLTVSGNLIVSGTTTTLNTTQLIVEDNLIGLASNNTGDAVDFGFYGQYDDTGIKYAGLYRDADDGTGVFKLFDGLGTEPTGTTISGGSLAALDVGALDATSITTTGTAAIGTLTLTTDLAVTHGGTGASSFTDNGIIYGNGTGALSVTAAGTQYQVLQAGSGGVPEWGSLDGGTF